MNDFPAEQRAGYLANVLAIARADGRVGPDELRVFDAVAHRIKASAADKVYAHTLTEGGQYRFLILDDLTTRLANLEDMLLMGLADGAVQPAESAPLEKLTAALGFSQVDVDMALRRATGRLSKLLKHPVAGAPAPPPLPAPARSAAPVRATLASLKASLHRKPGTPSAPRAPTQMIVAPWASKRSTPEAIAAGAAAESAPVTSVPVLSVPVPPPEAPAPQAQSVEAPPDAALETPLWRRCMAARAHAADPDAYCHGLLTDDPNVWGCRLAGMPLMPGADWLACGAFRDARTFVFDHEAIRDLLRERLTAAGDCPHLDAGRVARALAAFPDRASPGPRWMYRRATSEDGDGLPVTQTTYVHGCPVLAQLTARCLDPLGDGAGRRIRRDAGRGI